MDDLKKNYPSRYEDIMTILSRERGMMGESIPIETIINLRIRYTNEKESCVIYDYYISNNKFEIHVMAKHKNMENKEEHNKTLERYDFKNHSVTEYRCLYDVNPKNLCIACGDKVENGQSRLHAIRGESYIYKLDCHIICCEYSDCMDKICRMIRDEKKLT